MTMMAVKKITGSIIEGPYLLFSPTSATSQDRMALFYATRWVDLLASVAVLLLVLVWLHRQKKENDGDRWNKVLWWVIIVLLFGMATQTISGNLWRVFPGLLGNSFQRWFDTAVKFTALVAWPTVFALLLRLRLATRNAAWRLLTPIAIPTVAGHAYFTLNYFCIVKFLGCGCNLRGFNANDFSALFFLSLVPLILFLLADAASAMRPITRIGYIAAGCLLAFVLCWTRLNSCMWL